MSEWFPPADDALGGTADAVEGAGDFVFGGIGSTISNALSGAGETAGDAAGGFLGGLFGGLGDWVIKLLAIGVVGYVVAQAI